MQVSYNKLKIFNECRLKYRFSYIERLPRPPIAALAFHRQIHNALATYHHFAKRDGIVNEEQLLKAYDDILEIQRFPEAKESKKYVDGQDILRRYCKIENERRRIPVYLEHPLKVSFGSYMLTGKIDRIDFAENDKYSIIDYKLDRKLPHGNAAETDRQLSFYSLLVSEGLGMEIQDVRLNYLRHGVEHIGTRSRGETRETIEWIDSTASSIHKEKLWSPCAGPACSTCAFHSSCPAKTGDKRDNKDVWQQGDLLWEMQEPSDSVTEKTDFPSNTIERVIQMTLEDGL